MSPSGAAQPGPKNSGVGGGPERSASRWPEAEAGASAGRSEIGAGILLTAPTGSVIEGHAIATDSRRVQPRE